MDTTEYLKEKMRPETAERFERFVCRDAIHANCFIKFDMRDRIRILLFGSLHVEQVTYCENRPGYLVTEPTVTAKPFWETVRRSLFGPPRPEAAEVVGDVAQYAG